jgi:WD40 repeat protein
VLSGSPLASLCLEKKNLALGKANSAAFSPCGKRLVTASEDEDVKLWSTATGECIMTLRGHTDMVMHAEFSFDGSLLFTAALDNKARGSFSLREKDHPRSSLLAPSLGSKIETFVSDSGDRR